MVVPLYRSNLSQSQENLSVGIDSSIFTNSDQRQKDLESIELAVRNVEKFISADNNFPSLADKLKIRSGIATKSGLHESEYPNTTDLTTVLQLKLINKVPIPNEILEHFSRVHCHSIMGTFSEIRRAWFVLDSDLFLWDYEYGTDVAYFDGVSEVIISVGLVKPKFGIFQDFVHYLLVLATPSNIIVLGVTFSKPNKSFTAIEEMHITQEVVYTLSTDGVMFSTIVGTENGRIFMGAKDGCLYEFVYQKEVNWWGKRCKKVNHSSSSLSVMIPSFLNVFNEIDEITQISVDNSRCVLYTLSTKGSIEMYDLGDDGQSMSKVASFSYSSISNNVIKIMEESCLLGTVISINAIEVHHSALIALVATMESGTRLYFAVTSINRPSSLQLAHVRLPPGYTGSSPAQRPTKIRASVYNRDTCLLINSNEGCQDKLWCLSGDLTPFNSHLSETLTIAGLDGVVWSLEKYNHDFLFNSNSTEPPLLVTQHYELSTKYVCLTDKGSEIFQKLRPVDVIREILEEGHDPGSDVLKNFFRTMTEDEICASFLLLACQKSGSEHISNIATRGFFLYGGEPRLETNTNSIISPLSRFQQATPLGFNPGSVSTPIGQNQMSSLMRPEQSSFQFSHKHNGLYIFLSRTMRPVWLARVTHCVKIDNKMQWIIPELAIDRVNLVINHLTALLRFMEINPNIVCVPSLNNVPGKAINDSSIGTPTNNRMLHEWYMQEKKSLQASKNFVTRACEVLNLWKVLFDHHFHLVASALSPDELNYLSSATFGDLILSGAELCNTLINKLLNLYLDDNSSIDAISTKLRKVCPSLFLIEDAACAKAIEMIMFSKGKLDAEEKQKTLNDSLKILKGVCPKINLSAICSQYLDVGFHLGIYELCQSCAKKIDHKNLGLQYYKNGGLPYSLEHVAYTQRMNFYKEITNALEYLYEKQNNFQDHSVNISILKSTSFMSSTMITPCEQVTFQDMVKLCLSSDDELLHSAIYSWMIYKKLNRELVTHGKPSLDFFLQRSSASEQFASHDVKEILWMFQERQGNHAGAADVLYNLAKEPSDCISLEKRLHYLSHAMVCMKSDKTGAAPHVGVLHQEVEDTLQVAQIQMKIYKILSNSVHARTFAELSAPSLNSKLYNLTELYENYADPYNLWEIKLDIIDCSNMSTPDNNIVPEIWENVINEELLKCVSKNPNDLIVCVTTKVKSVLKNIRLQSPIFAVEFLIYHLELVSCKLGASKNFVHSLMTELNVPAQKITDIYEKLYVVNSSCWEENGDEYHIIAAIGSFADHLVRNAKLSTAQKKQTALKLNDLITHCLNMLYSKQTNERLSELIRWLKVVQSKFNKI